MTRTYAISGSASGIGKATATLLKDLGHRVIGIDVRDADVVADLASAAGCASLPDRVSELASAGLDAVLAIAGGPTEVNYLSTDTTAIAAATELAMSQGRENLLYATSKRAVSQWIRRNSIAPQWAGAGIPLNAVAPGIIRTPMTEPILATEDGRKSLLEMVLMPLAGPAGAMAVAKMLAWMTGEDNSRVTGQVIFLDGGADATIRGDLVFDASHR